ncbi:MAG: glycosyltransferase family 4 protein [Planctomycetes bacterium]|nr:glycosyltransferase family 4 protein [Planctomycetota bacterium]
MKILVTSPIFPPDLGGPATYVPSLATWLAKRGHDVTVVAFCSDPEPQGWPFRVISIPRCWMPLRYWKDFVAVWRQAKDCDVMYINEHLALHVALAGRLRGKPMVIRVCVDGTWEITHRLGWHDDTITDYQHRLYDWRVAFARKLQRLWWGWMKRIVAPSQFLKSIVEGYGVPPARTELIYNAYHGPEDFTRTRAECRDELGLPHDRVVLLSICRLMIWKGVDGLVRALTKLPDDHHLYVAGDGDELDSWTKLAEDLGVAERVHFLGNVPHKTLMGWIRAADVFLLNSTYEGLSHTLLEVMWLGLPAAVSNVCGNPELIEDRVTGRSFDPQDVDAIVAAVRDLLDDPETTATYVARSKQKVSGFARDGLFARKEHLFLSVAGKEH